MHEEHPVFERPADPGTSVWRYMNFAKFISMLHTQSLFFCRADLLGDPFEGSLTRLNRTLRDLSFGDLPSSQAEEARQMLERTTRSMPLSVAINCWHISDYESAAMWRLYSPSGDGVAVKSTVGRLCASFKNYAPAVYVGTVSYIDYDDPSYIIPVDNLFHPFLHKRRSFEHERELRAISANGPIRNGTGWNFDFADMDPGALVQVVLTELIEEVRISPAAADWLCESILAAGAAFGLTCPVVRSSLDTPAHW